MRTPGQGNRQREGGVLGTTSGTTRDEAPVISASEVGRYVYCARAWWLQRVIGRVPGNQAALRAGGLRHEEHGHAARGAQQQMLWFRRLLAFVALLAIVLVLSLLLTQAR